MGNRCKIELLRANVQISRSLSAPRPTRRRITSSRIVLIAVRIVVFAGAATSVFFDSAACHAATSPDVERVTNAWLARSGRIRTAEFEWKLTTTDKRGSYTEFSAKNGGPAGVVPAQDTTHTSQHRLIFDGANLRLDTDGPQWNTASGQLQKSLTANVFSSGRMETLQPAVTEGSPGAGTIYELPRFNHLHSCEVFALGLFLVPLNEQFGAVALPPLEAATESSTQPGELCLTDARHLHHLWVDASRPEIVRRFEFRRSAGDVWIEGLLEWQDDPQDGPVPTRWLVTMFNDDGAVERVHDAQVTRYSINAPLPADAFIIEYPPGATLTDEIEHREYVIDADGERQPLRVHAGQSGFGGTWWGVGLLAAALAFAVLYKRMHVPRSFAR